MLHLMFLAHEVGRRHAERLHEAAHERFLRQAKIAALREAAGDRRNAQIVVTRRDGSRGPAKPAADSTT